jgi:hypothetical protein
MIHTVTNTYFATGEGITHMVLFIKGTRQDAEQRFETTFGEYLSQGREITEGLRFDFNGSKLMLTEELKAKLSDWYAQAGGLEYYAKLHVNLS